MKIITILLAALMIATTGCTSSQSGSDELTTPSKWTLVSFVTAGNETPVVEGSTITLEFSDNKQLGGSGGCNSYGAEYELQGKDFSVKQVVSTLMACVDNEVMEQETQYIQALQRATTYETSGDNLMLFYDDGQSQLNFVKR